MIPYKSKKEKLKEHIDWALNKMMDGDGRNYEQFLAKCIIETGNKKEVVEEYLNYYATLKKVIIDKKQNTIMATSIMDKETEKDLKELELK